MLGLRDPSPPARLPSRWEMRLREVEYKGVWPGGPAPNSKIRGQVPSLLAHWLLGIGGTWAIQQGLGSLGVTLAQPLWSPQSC